MNHSLGKQFSQFLSSGDFHAANQIIKQARSLSYPHVLINSWENSLDKLEPGFRHPLDSVEEPTLNEYSLVFQLDPALREVFKNNIIEYCSNNNISLNIVDNIVDNVFNGIDQDSGKILVPDMTANEPDKNLIEYSVYDYSIDNPDIPEAVKRGVISSELDHFLRFGYFEILDGRRYSSICFSHEREKYSGKLLYIVDDYKNLNDSEKEYLKSPQLDKFLGDVFSVKHNSVFTNDGLRLGIENYLFQNISEYHNLCILLANKTLASPAAKWIIDIKLKDRTAIFGYSESNGRFCSVTEFSYFNMLVSDITNGFVIVNPIEALSIVDTLKEYKSAYGFYHAFVLQLHQIGVEFCLKKEILSQSRYDRAIKVSSVDNACWSPFFWTVTDKNTNKLLLASIRRDFIKTWTRHLARRSLAYNSAESESIPLISPETLIVTLDPKRKYTVAVVIPFKDQIHLLEDCVESLILKKEEISFRIYAVNNNSSEPKTFEVLSLLKDKYPDQFICIDSPGEFNYAKINNEAVNAISEDYILFLNNDILVDSNFAITTLLKTHLFYNAIITGSKLLYPSGKIQHNGLAITQEKHIAVHSPFRGQRTNLNHELLSDRDLHPWDHTHECTAVTAACLLMKTDDFLSIGGFDETFKVAYNDVDLCFRARENYFSRPIICTTDLKIYHLESESRGMDTDNEKAARLYHERINLVNRHENLFSKPDPFTGIDSPYDDVHKVIKTTFDRKFIGQSSSSKSDIELEEIGIYQYYSSRTQKYACIFVHFEKDSLIPADCVHHIEKLSEYCDIFFVSSSELLATLPEEIDKIKPFCRQILIRKNSGYDFGCWSHVIRKNYDELCEYEGVLLANDSNWGPLNDFSDTFSKINSHLTDVDFLGLTSSTTPTWHLQSFFVMYSRKVFTAPYFKQHWFNVGLQDSKFDIIMNYEVSWCTRLRRLGFQGMSLYVDSTANNPTHVDWEKLINNKYPYLKKELIRDNPLRIDLSRLSNVLSSYDKDWCSYLLDYLKRYGKDQSNIAKALRQYEATANEEPSAIQ